MKKIKSIIFDLGAVLLNISYQKTIEEFDKLGIKNSSTLYSKKKQSNIFNLLETGEITKSDFITEIQKYCTEATDSQVLYAWNAMLLDLPPNRLQLLKELETDFNIYLLSNTNAIHINEFKNKLGNKKYNEFYQLFDKIYYSHEIGCRKPDAEAFQIIIDENNLIAEEVLFIDDSSQHIEGAKKLGIQTHHLLDVEDVISLFPDKVL